LWWCKHAAYGIGLTLRHVTPERVLHSNLRLLAVNLLKPEQLREKSFDLVAVEQPQVNGGELVDSFGSIAHHRRTVKFLPSLSVVSCLGGDAW